MRLPELPEAVRRNAAIHGEDAWVARLPGVVADLVDRWGITLGSVCGDGTEALVVEAVTDTGVPAVLKVVLPVHPGGAEREIAVLRAAGGVGYPELYAADEPAGAYLMERLGPPLDRLGLPLAERLEVLVGCAEGAWRVAPGLGLPTGADKAGWLAERIGAWWEEQGRPCSAAAVDHAIACAGRRGRAHDPERAVLVHGDVHQWNALRSGGGWKLVDPDGLLAEREYDLGVILREDPSADDPRDRARWLAGRTGCDAQAVWEWGAAERVATGLFCLAVGLAPVGTQMLALADELARSGLGDELA